MKHWADQYRGYHSGTLEGKIYLTACCVVNCTEEQARTIGQYAYDNNCSIWHALWHVAGRQGKCYCGPCSKERGEG